MLQRLAFFLLLLFCIGALFSCNSEPESPEKKVLIDERLGEQGQAGNYVESQLVSENTRCLHAEMPELREELRIDFLEDGASCLGRGTLTLKKMGMAMRIELRGRAIGEGKMEMQIFYFNDKESREQGVEFTEIWSYDSRGFWKVGNRTYEKHYQGPVAYMQVRCSQGDTSARYDAFYGFFGGYAVVQIGQLQGLVDSLGKESISVEHRDMSAVNEGTVSFSDPNTLRYGIMDVQGKILIEPKYAKTNPLNDGLIAVLDNQGAWGFCNKAGKLVIPHRYNSINIFDGLPTKQPFQEGLANVYEAGRAWGFIDKSGKEVIPLKYTHADGFENGRARVFHAKVQGPSYIDKQGRCIENCEGFD